MPKRLLLPVLVLLLSGCTDSLGIGSGCAAEMRAVRLREGPPQDTDRDEVGGDFIEVWFYSSHTYTFRWGTTYERCQVTGPTRFSRLPAGG